MIASLAVQQPPQFRGCMNCGPATTHLYCCLHAWPGIVHLYYSFVCQELTSSTPRRTFPYECDMAAGAFPDEFLLRSTEPTQKKKKKKEEEKKMNNLAVPGPRTNAQGSNRPFGLSPLTLTLG